MSLLLLFAGPAGPVDVVGADTGAGAETWSITATISAAETGTGADLAALVAALTGSDTGAGTDAATLAVTLAVTDAGSGLDAATIAAVLQLAETGSGTDAAEVLAALSSSDTAAASDLAALIAAIAGSDTGSGADADGGTTPPTELDGSEQGTATDAVAQILATLSDSEGWQWLDLHWTRKVGNLTLLGAATRSTPGRQRRRLGGDP